MKVNIPVIIQDPSTVLKDKEITEGFIPVGDFFLSGPITDKIAVLNFNEEGGLKTSAFFKPPEPGKKLGCYVDESGNNVRELDDIYSDAFRSVSVFAMVLKTITLFEGTDKKKIDTIGRPLKWGFDSPQLFVVPDAGYWANAYYCRESNSLHFYHFSPKTDPSKTIYTGLSRDIVSHETGHAIVDSIAPDLLDSYTPQSLAIHEAIADLTAMLIAFGSNKLRLEVLADTRGKLENPTMFSSIAEEFGKEIYQSRGCLRSLHEFKSLNPDDEAYVGSFKPHVLSLVLSNALYEVMLKIYNSLWEELASQSIFAKFEDPRYSSSGYALAKASVRFKRMMFRGLDVLPPGCISFADFGRAIIAVDTIAYREAKEYRNWITEAFLKRSIVKDRAQLDVLTDIDVSLGDEVDDIYRYDFAAYKFANDNRDMLLIPEEVRFTVRPRLLAVKKYDKDVEKRECIFKVTWDHIEANPVGLGLPTERMIRVGTTLLFDMDTGEALTRLSNAPPPLGKETDPRGRTTLFENECQWRQRNDFIVKLWEEEVLKFGDEAYGPDRIPILSAVKAENIGGVMRLSDTGKMLHILKEGEWDE